MILSLALLPMLLAAEAGLRVVVIPKARLVLVVPHRLGCAKISSVSTTKAFKAARCLPPASAAPMLPTSDDLFMKTPLTNFLSGASWVFGFVMALVALQTVSVTLAVKQSESESELQVWSIMAVSGILAGLGTYRLLNLLAKKQLEHACLQRKVLLTEPYQPMFLDLMLLTALSIYLCDIIFWVGLSSFSAVIVVLTALAAPAWTIVKALQRARETEEELTRVEATRFELLAVLLAVLLCHKKMKRLLVAWKP